MTTSSVTCVLRAVNGPSLSSFKLSRCLGYHRIHSGKVLHPFKSSLPRPLPPPLRTPHARKELSGREVEPRGFLPLTGQEGVIKGVGKDIPCFTCIERRSGGLRFKAACWSLLSWRTDVHKSSVLIFLADSSMPRLELLLHLSYLPATSMRWYTRSRDPAHHQCRKLACQVTVLPRLAYLAL